MTDTCEAVAQHLDDPPQLTVAAIEVLALAIGECEDLALLPTGLLAQLLEIDAAAQLGGERGEPGLDVGGAEVLEVEHERADAAEHRAGDAFERDHPGTRGLEIHRQLAAGAALTQSS